MNESQRRCERIYNALLMLYSKEFREEYGDEMTTAFADLYRDRRRNGGNGALVALWLWALLDISKGVLKERGEMSALSVPLRAGGLAALGSGVLLTVGLSPILAFDMGVYESNLSLFASQAVGLVLNLGHIALVGLVLGLYLHLKDRLFGKWNLMAVSAMVLSMITAPLLLIILFGDLILGPRGLGELLGVHFYLAFLLPGVDLGRSLSLFLMGVVTLKATPRGAWRWLPLVASILLSPLVAQRVAPIASFATGYAYDFNWVQTMMPFVGAIVSLAIAYAIFTGRLVRLGSEQPG